MCGIAGVLNLRDDCGISTGAIKQMLSIIKHRGPDEFGQYEDNHISLGHARLSIIDLSGGQQPMSNETGSIWISFNGEIFNYLELRKELSNRGHYFSTHSDTEVIIHLYEDFGAGCLKYLNGQFAIAIWDKNKKELFLARDRMGIRPLFYTRTDSNFIFSSEIKAIFASGSVERRINPAALGQIFTLWCNIPPITAFENIHELPPAHYVIVKDGTITEKQYWDIDFSSGSMELSFEDASESLKNLLIDSTRLQLRADVPVGAYLSGGLDSSVTAMLIRNFTNSSLHTFSVAFEDKDYDESNYQIEMANALGTEHHEIKCTYEDISRNFPEVIWHTEKPVLRTSPVPLFLLSKLVRERNFKVVLTGEGADEVLCGYDIFKETKIREFWAKSPDSKWRPLLFKRLYPYLPALQEQPKAYRDAFFKGGLLDLSDSFFSHRTRWQTTSKNKLFFSERVKEAINGNYPEDMLITTLNPDFKIWRPLIRAQYIELKTLLPGFILSSQGDRVAMAHSVEGRFPFLDHRVVEFCAKLPLYYKMKGLNEKFILKKAMESYLLKNIVKRTKQPYLAPDTKSFFSGAIPYYVEELLSEEYIKKYDYFKYDAVNLLVNKCKSGKVVGFKDNMAFVGILSTQLLHRQFIDKFDFNNKITEPIRIISHKGNSSPEEKDLTR